MERFKRQKLINEKVAECLKRIDPKNAKILSTTEVTHRKILNLII